MDSSASVSHYEFSRVREFLGQLAAPLPLGPGALRASLVHVSSQPHTEFPFGQHHSGAALQDAIRAAAQLMGDTNTGSALAYAKEQLFAEAAGARPGVPKVLVWVTDGGSSDPIGPPMQELKDLGVTVFIVSTGRGNLLELSAAASAPAEKHLHFVDVDDLRIIAPELRRSILGGWEWAGPGAGPGGARRASEPGEPSGERALGRALSDRPSPQLGAPRSGGATVRPRPRAALGRRGRVEGSREEGGPRPEDSAGGRQVPQRRCQGHCAWGWEPGGGRTASWGPHFPRPPPAEGSWKALSRFAGSSPQTFSCTAPARPPQGRGWWRRAWAPARPAAATEKCHQPQGSSQASACGLIIHPNPEEVGLWLVERGPGCF